MRQIVRFAKPWKGNKTFCTSHFQVFEATPLNSKKIHVTLFEHPHKQQTKIIYTFFTGDYLVISIHIKTNSYKSNTIWLLHVTWINQLHNVLLCSFLQLQFGMSKSHPSHLSHFEWTSKKSKTQWCVHVGLDVIFTANRSIHSKWSKTL